MARLHPLWSLTAIIVPLLIVYTFEHLLLQAHDLVLELLDLILHLVELVAVDLGRTCDYILPVNLSSFIILFT